MKKAIQFPIPVFISKESKWFVAECSLFNLATQGRTETEVKKNMKDLIIEYLKDPDVSKPPLREIPPSSLTYIPISTIEVGLP